MMDLAVVPSAQRHSELIAYLTAERAVLCEAQMMRVRRLTAANQTWLFDYEPDVVLVPKPAGLGMS
jgi:hypothetical protein